MINTIKKLIKFCILHYRFSLIGLSSKYFNVLSKTDCTWGVKIDQSHVFGTISRISLELTWASASVYWCWSLLLLIERQIRLSAPKYILLLFISQYWLSMLYFWNVSSSSTTQRYSPAGSDLIFLEIFPIQSCHKLSRKHNLWCPTFWKILKFLPEQTLLHIHFPCVELS